MNIVKWKSPWANIDFFKDPFNGIFDGSFFPSLRLDNESDFKAWIPSVDVYEHNEKTIIKAELPGLDKDDINIDVKDGMLVIKGERNYEKEVKEENFYRRECAYGKFHLSLIHI